MKLFTSVDFNSQSVKNNTFFFTEYTGNQEGNPWMGLPRQSARRFRIHPADYLATLQNAQIKTMINTLHMQTNDCQIVGARKCEGI